MSKDCTTFYFDKSSKLTEFGKMFSEVLQASQQKENPVDFTKKRIAQILSEKKDLRSEMRKAYEEIFGHNFEMTKAFQNLFPQTDFEKTKPFTSIYQLSYQFINAFLRRRK